MGGSAAAVARLCLCLARDDTDPAFLTNLAFLKPNSAYLQPLMDPHNYAAPSRVGALVLPVGTLKVSQFQQYFERLGEAAEVSLIDVHLPAGADGRSTEEQHKHFDPQTNPTGHVMFNFQTQPTADPVKSLFDLEPWRQQMLVVGIVHSQAIEEEKLDLKKQLSALRQAYPSALCHVILVFGVHSTSAGADWPSGVFPVLSSNWTSLETVLSTVTGIFLAALSSFWITRRLSTFQSPAAKIGPSTATSRPTRQATHLHTASALEPVVGRHGSISMGSAERAKSKQEGRTRKFLGSLYLLSGRLSDAVAELGTAAAVLKEANDILWHASALDTIGLALVMQKFASSSSMSPVPVSFISSAWTIALRQLKSSARQSKDYKDQQHHQQPDVAHSSAQGRSPPHSPRSSVSNVSTFSLSRVRSLKKAHPFTSHTPIEEMLEFTVKAVLEDYSLGANEEVVPYTVYYETLIRFTNLLVSLRLGRGWTEAALSSAIRATPIVSGPVATAPSIASIEEWISHIHNPELSKLPVEPQTRILTAVASIYSRAGLQRKWAFTCAQIVSILAASADAPVTDLGAVDSVLEVYSTWPRLEANTLRKLVALGQRMCNPEVQTKAASRLLAMAQHNWMTPQEQMALYQLIRSFGDVVQSSYWDDNIVVEFNVKTHRLATVRAPKSDSGILYNPFEGTESKNEGSVEAGVATNAKILLQNPFAVDLQVFELFLVDSDGNPVSDVAKEVTIPANTMRFRVDTSITPPADQPDLVVAGCYVQVSGCEGQIYWKPATRIHIAPARPVLVLQELTLQKGWTMLLEGERKRFAITLWNCSQRTASSVMHFGFHDSTVDPLRSAASKQDVQRAEFYEYEYFLHRRRAIDMVSSIEPIEPRGSQKFEFDLTGKRGITSAAILVDYGLTEETLRRLRIPLQVTVCPSVSVERANLVPTQSASVVLLVLDLRNSWREGLGVTLWSGTESAKSNAVKHRIESQQTRRFLLEVPWEPLDAEELQRPIPSLSNKQFTVDTRTTPDQLRAFWLRERLLERIHGEWEMAAGRSGYVELRSVQLSRQMVGVLISSTMEVSMPLTPATSNCLVDTPVSLQVHVKNNSPTNPARGMFRLIPSKTAQRYVLFMGSTQRLLNLDAGEEAIVRVDVVFLSQGPFQFTSVFDIIGEDGRTEPVFQTDKAVFNVHTKQ